MLHLTVLAALLPSCLAQEAGSAPPQAEVPPPALLDHAALSARLEELTAAHPDLAQKILLGRSRGGRDIVALRLASGEIAPGRPAILVVGNLEGPQVFSSALVLWQAERLLERAASDDKVRALLADTTLYLLPRANPDGAQARFSKPLSEAEATGRGVDDDRDGREGEDPPQDVDGDGVIAWMRVPDPEGTWIPDPTDARASIEADAKKGERGRFKLVREGRDLDGDERISEDGPADAVVNRNFASQWREHEAASGQFPMDEPEARALAEFVLGHHDVALVLAYGALDNLVEAPKTAKEAGSRGDDRIPPAGWLEADAALLAEIARRRKELVGEGTKGPAEAGGSFTGWAYDHRGLFALAVVPWDIPLEDKKDEKGERGKDAAPEKGAEEKAESGVGEEAKEEPKAEAQEEKGPAEQKGKKDEPKPSDEAKRLKWCDAQAEGARFHSWTSFQHPELGEVEIGGWMPYARVEPPAERADEIARLELDFLLTLGALLPRVALVETHARELSPGLVEVEAVVENAALLPVRSASARRTDTVRAARARLLLPEGATRVAGGRQELIGELAGSGGRRELRWLVSGSGVGAGGIEVDSDHAGRIQQRVEVER